MTAIGQRSNTVAKRLGAKAIARIDLPTGEVNFKGFLGKFFLAKPRSSSGYAIAGDKKQFRLGAGMLPTSEHIMYAWLLLYNMSP